MKPMLASDWEEKRQSYPVFLQPKIDGVRALNLLGRLTGRSLKEFNNVYITEKFSIPEYVGFDGEMAADKEMHPDLCRLTTSALGTIAGAPLVMWHIFDLVTVATAGLPYAARWQAMSDKVAGLPPDLAACLHVVPQIKCDSRADVEYNDEILLDLGYEGTILRAPGGVYKHGRSTVREGGLLRIKRFNDSEGVVVSIQEGQTNNNEAKINELGHTERSSHQENMSPNGMIGTLSVKLLSDITFGNKTLHKGEIVTISAGRLTAQERENYWNYPNTILQRIVKFQYFPKGVKDKLRFPTFQSFRSDVDM